MKCSSRRNCNTARTPARRRPRASLNEVQLPKELQLTALRVDPRLGDASMKCSSRRNCNSTSSTRPATTLGLNEVQLPKELQHPSLEAAVREEISLNEVQLPKELQPENFS